MSKVLLVRHLPINLSFQDKEHLLKHFGAEKVWETVQKRNYIFASFSSAEKAESVLRRLHQLEVAQRRLVVEYSFEKEPFVDKRKNKEDSQATIKIKEFLRILNAWNPSVNFYQPPPPHLNYKYPAIDPNIAVNIIFALFKHAPLYNQVLHLMNKMSLDVPFSNNPESVRFFKETFRLFFLDEIFVPPPHLRSESESEIESGEENDYPKPNTPAQKPLTKRQHILPITRKRPATILSTASMSKPKKALINQKEVFDVVTPATESKKIISLVVHQDALQKPVEEPKVVGALGKFEKVEKPPENIPEAVIEEPPTITRKELLKNRLSYSDMKLLPVFKNYHPGEPSMRLYIKNLAKTTTEQDVKRIYKGYTENLSEEEQNGFDVRVMQEGRMKGQAFVTFPSIKLAETALNETNGYLLNDKPMVVQFARAANKKTID
ncbi:RNA-binding region-containing protein 3-like [Zerene cesonia]|uniref:RNA-binding region-containing protein 3-like n=1 Tax=Zerene cesonia TaxID=33412 RepID=UPI0018E56FDF|nr:RNA-binding region-containing protein 3-like [Zerene cesonia]